MLALSVALVPSERRLSGSPRRGCNLDPGCRRLELTRRSPQDSAWLLYLRAIIALPTARNSNEVARRDSYVVILIPETADSLGFCEVAGLVGGIRVGNRVGVGLTRSTVSSYAPI